MTTTLHQLKSVERLAHHLARRATPYASEYDDLAQEARLAAHRFLQKHPQASQQLLGCVMWRQVVRYKNRVLLRHRCPRGQHLLPDTVLVDVPTKADDNLLLEDFLSLLERECGHTARAIVENLLAPEDACCCELILRDVARGRRITNQHIRQGLGIPPREWRETMIAIRGVASVWLAG